MLNRYMTTGRARRPARKRHLCRVQVHGMARTECVANPVRLRASSIRAGRTNARTECVWAATGLTSLSHSKPGWVNGPAPRDVAEIRDARRYVAGLAGQLAGRRSAGTFPAVPIVFPSPTNTKGFPPHGTRTPRELQEPLRQHDREHREDLHTMPEQKTAADVDARTTAG